jgi:hypothetical protein
VASLPYMRIWRLSTAATIAAALICGPALASPEPASLTGSDEASLREASLTLDVAFRGLIAEVSARHVLVNEGDENQLGIYTFSLPREAAVTALSIKLPGQRAAGAFAVDAEAAVRPVPRATITEGEPDIGLLRMVSRTESHATYELRVFPVPAGEAVEVRIGWASPLALRDGRLSLRIPDRGQAPNLARERITWRLEPPPGAGGIEGAFARGTRVDGARRRDGAHGIELGPMTAPVTGNIVLEAVPRFLGSSPRASHGVVELEPGVFATAGWAYYPRAAPPEPESRPRRVLIVANVSRSMSEGGLAGAASLAEALLQAADGAEVEAILFDRRARAVFGELRRNNAETRRALRAALTPDTPRNGTDLLAALALVRAHLEGDAPPDLVVVMSDELLPAAQTTSAALSAAGRRALERTSVLAITLLPDHATLPERPDLAAAPLAALADASGGLALTLRHGEVEGRGAELLGELASSPPLVGTAFADRGRRFEPLALPETLSVGTGAVAAGFAREPRVPELELVAHRRGGREQIPSERSELLDRLAFALAAVQSDPSTLLPLAPAEPAAPDPQARALRALHRAALASPVVTAHTSLVIPGEDGYGRARSETARAWGSWLYRRLSPPPERRPDHELRRFESRLVTASPPPPRRTGTLTRPAVERALAASLPRIRHCYERMLRGDSKLEGSLTLEVELARGEVLSARARDVRGLPEKLSECAAEAAYAIRIPRVALGDEPEARVVARYPLELRSGRVRAIRLELPPLPGASPGAPALDPADPLGGLPRAR